MKTRAIILIILSLLISFLLGFISSNQIHHFRTKDVRSMSSIESFKERSFSLIQPTEEQITNLEPIIDEYAVLFDSLRKSTFIQFKEFMDEFYQKLNPYMTEEQIKQTEDFCKHFRKPHKHKDREKN